MRVDIETLQSSLEEKMKAINIYEVVKNFVFNRMIYFYIIYLLLIIILLYMIIISTQDIIDSKLITFIINTYAKEKVLTVSTIVGLGGAFTLLIGHISSENEENIFEKQGKLFSGIVFLHKNLIKISTLILVVFFTITYYGTIEYLEYVIFSILFILFYIILLHFMVHLHSSYDWKTLENKELEISFNKSLAGFAFNLVFLFYIFSLQYVQTLTFIFLNFWILFMSTLFFASLKFPRTKRVIIQYLDNKEEYVHLVRIENGFARLITKNCISKQINLSEIKQINYDNNYIEDFRQDLKRTHPWNK